MFFRWSVESTINIELWRLVSAANALNAERPFSIFRSLLVRFYDLIKVGSAF